jgi:basic amino acid/polyamine antiporter, APA family
MPSTLSADTKPSLAAASQRDVGLTRAIGPWALAASIVNVVVGAGIFAVPAALAANVGPYAPLAFLVCAGVITSVAICFAEGGSRLPTSGGAYGYVNAAFGPFTGYVAGTTLWFSNTLACGGIAAALADLAGSLFPPPMRSFVHVAAILGVVGGMALVNLGGVARGTRLVTAATVLKLIPLGVFVIAGAGAIQRANFTPVGRPHGENLGRALILALFTFTGMETPLSASGEVAQPARTIPRALVISIAFVTALYVAIQVIAQGILGPSLAHSDAPLAMFGWIGSDMLGTPRVLFAFARDGLLPRPLGRIHATTSAPHVAILSYATLVIVLALTGTFAELAVLSTLCIAVLYSAACAAAFWLARARVALAGPPLNFRWLGVAAGMAISSMVVLVAMASRAEIFGLLAVLCLSAAVYLLQTRLGRRPA